jgi:hypothetical protein
VGTQTGQLTPYSDGLEEPGTNPGTDKITFPCARGLLPGGVKPQEHEADHSLLSSAEIRNGRVIYSTYSYVFRANCLIKHRHKLRLLLQERSPTQMKTK